SELLTKLKLLNNLSKKVGIVFEVKDLSDGGDEGGPRSKLNKGSINGNPKLHPAAPKGSTLPSQSLTRSDITTNASASNKSKSD
ncbi:14936_t:CDS:2, partial [Entrophospora sp. SA101]